MALFQVVFVQLKNPRNWIALAFGLATVHLVNFVRKVRRLPPGPLPLPLIGNILQLRQPRPFYEKAQKWTVKYGDPITVWLGPRPVIIASTIESFTDISGPHRNNLGGRMPTNFGKLVTKGRQGITFSDANPSWDVLRRVAHVAIRKYAQTERLSHLVAEKVDQGLEKIFTKGKKIDSEVIHFAEDVIFKVLAESAFGGFEDGDPRFEEFRKANRIFEKEAANGLPSDILPILRWVFYKQEEKVRKALTRSVDLIEERFKEVAATFQPGQSRHFSDALLNTRNSFIADERDSAKYLEIENLCLVLVEIFEAGIGTSRSVLAHCVIHLANEPELQEELRQEVLDVIGSSQICLNSDRDRMPKLDSFLQEVLRLHPPAPLSLPRKALVDAMINGRLVPKDSFMFINVFAVNRDPAIWGEDAAEWNPKRFLTASREQLAKGFFSFGIGARSCPGEKMAQADLFYSLVRLLQKAQVATPQGEDTVDLTVIDSDIQIEPQRQNIHFISLQ